MNDNEIAISGDLASIELLTGRVVQWQATVDDVVRRDVESLRHRKVRHVVTLLAHNRGLGQTLTKE